MTEHQINFIKDQHRRVNQLYDGLPYYVHLQEVVRYVKKYIRLIPIEYRDIVMLAGWGHDLQEDTGLSYNKIKNELGEEVADLIYILSNNKGKNREERANDNYYKNIRENHLANYIKICDRLGNMFYGKVNGSDKYKMYLKELPHFKESIYNGMYDEMWEEMSNIDSIVIGNIYYPMYQKFDKSNINFIKLPRNIPAALYKELYIKGIIPKKELIKGKYYFGKCRNSNTALWNGYVFVYMRNNFGTLYPEDINHLEDDNGYDLFIPLEETTPNEDQIVKYI